MAQPFVWQHVTDRPFRIVMINDYETDVSVYSEHQSTHSCSACVTSCASRLTSPGTHLHRDTPCELCRKLHPFVLRQVFLHMNIAPFAQTCCAHTLVQTAPEDLCRDAARGVPSVKRMRTRLRRGLHASPCIFQHAWKRGPRKLPARRQIVKTTRRVVCWAPTLKTAERSLREPWSRLWALWCVVVRCTTDLCACGVCVWKCVCVGVLCAVCRG